MSENTQYIVNQSITISIMFLLESRKRRELEGLKAWVLSSSVWKKEGYRRENFKSVDSRKL